MRYCLLPLFLACLAAGLAHGPLSAGSRPPSSASERVRQFQRDRGLIQTLVESSLRLADAKEPVRRATQCTAIAEQLAHEIRQAAQHNEGSRVAELGHYLHAVLERGVAANVNSARRQTLHALPDPAFEHNLQEVRDRTVKYMRSLEEELERTADPGAHAGIRRALQDVQDGRTEVERALKAPDEPGSKERQPPNDS